MTNRFIDDISEEKFMEGERCMKVFKFVGAFAGLVFLFSCSTVNNSKISKNPTTVRHQRTSKNLTSVEEKKFVSKNPGIATQNKKSKLIFVPMPSLPPSMRIQKKASALAGSSNKQGFKNGIKISVENMPINKFINLVFNNILKSSYFIDRSIETDRTPVTLKMNTNVSPKAFLDMVSQILSKYRIAINEKNGIFFIAPGRSTTTGVVPPFFIGRSLPQNISSSQKVGIIVPFYYVSAFSYRGLIKDLSLSVTSKILVPNGTNCLMITDTASKIRAALKLVSLFDRPYFAKKRAVLLKMNYIPSSAFLKKLKIILPSEGIPISTLPYKPGITLIPMNELNSLLIVSPKQKWINIVEFWKNKLDTISALGNQPHLFVFYPKNRRAKDLGEVFSKLGSSIIKKNKESASSTALAKGIKFMVDEDRNALVILATPQEYEQIKDVLEKLDTLPKQVLVQVTIAEVTLTDNLQYGIEWYLRHTGRWNGNLQTLGQLGIGASGITYSVISNTSKFKALLNAYAHKNLINVLSSPRIVVLDNQEASINVGTQVPTLTSTASNSTVSDNGTSALVSTIQYRKTGVILHIKPTINSNGILTMTISQEVSQPQTNNVSKIDSPLILNRDVNTSVVLKSGSTLLLGGLIKTTKSNTVSKVPILGDIPLIGNIFKTTSKSTVKTELIIEITPYILSNTAEGVKATQRFESLLKWFHGE